MYDRTSKRGAFARGKVRRHHPSFDKTPLHGWKVMHKEAGLPHAGWEADEKRGQGPGLPGADSVEDQSIPTFSRGEPSHFAGITYRPGTRFGPRGIRCISALYTPYNYGIGVDLREQMSMCDIGDVLGTVVAHGKPGSHQHMIRGWGA